MRRLAIISLAVIVAGLLGVVAAGPVSAGPLSGASKFVPLDPQRVLDSRVGLGTSGFVLPGATVTLAMPGRGGVPTVGATAVLLNVTLAEAAGPGYVQVFPTGRASVGASSNLNIERAGQTVPNLVVAPLGDVGQVSIFTEGGGQLIADVFGYFVAATSSTDGRYVPVFPNRLLDTRAQAPGKLGVGGSVRVQVAGRSGVPNAGAEAVVLNVTATDATDAGFVQVLPTGGSVFGAFSNLNLVRGQTVPNLVIVPLGADGSVTLFSERGTHLVVDVFGYFTSAVADVSSDGLFVPLAPERLVDSRFGPKPAGGSLTTIAPAGRAGIPAWGVAAVFGNLTATEPAAGGFLQVVPGPAASAPVGFWSNANVDHAGQTVPNAVIANLGSDATSLVYTSTGSHIVFDVSGYFTKSSNVNHAPSLNSIFQVVTGGQSVDIYVLDAASDPDGDPMSVSSFSQPGDGFVTQVAPGTIRYSSTASGDRFVNFSVNVTDNHGAAATATVTVHVVNGTVPATPSALVGTVLSWSNPNFGQNNDYQTAVAQVRLQWTDNADNETGYRIYGTFTNFGPAPPQVTRTLLATVGASSTSAVVNETGFSVHHLVYGIEVVAYNGSGESAPSPSADIYAPRPNVPQINSYVSNGTNTARITWTQAPNLGFRPSLFSVSSTGTILTPANYSLAIGADGVGTYTANLATAPQCLTIAAYYFEDGFYGGTGDASASACLATPGTDPSTRTFEAEYASLTGSPAPAVSSANAGYAGAGYVGTFGYVGQRITFTVHNNGTYTPYLISLRERTIESGAQRRLYVNGVNVGLVALSKTANAWTDSAWASTGTGLPVSLHQGDNTVIIEYVGNGGNGFADIDSITLNEFH